MTEQDLHPSAPEARDIKIPQEYLNELFDRTLKMVEEEKGGRVVAEFGPQYI